MSWFGAEIKGYWGIHECIKADSRIALDLQNYRLHIYKMFLLKWVFEQYE